MESHQTPTPRPSSDDARASLEAVDRVNADLADRIASPWWYYPGLGLIEALLVSSFTFHVWWLQLLVLIVALAGLRLLVTAWENLTGLGMSRRYNALARGWIIALMVVVGAAMAVVFLVDKPVVTAVTAGVVFVATVVLGRRAELTMQERLRHGARTR
jgi:hypothetical protein